MCRRPVLVEVPRSGAFRSVSKTLPTLGVSNRPWVNYRERTQLTKTVGLRGFCIAVLKCLRLVTRVTDLYAGGAPSAIAKCAASIGPAER